MYHVLIDFQHIIAYKD